MVEVRVAQQFRRRKNLDPCQTQMRTMSVVTPTPCSGVRSSCEMLHNVLGFDAGGGFPNILGNEQALGLVRQHHPPFENRRKNDNA